MISGEFYIENDYLDVLLGCSIALENQNLVFFSWSRKSQKKRRFSEKFDIFDTQFPAEYDRPSRIFLKVEKIYEKTDFPPGNVFFFKVARIQHRR